MYLSHWTLLHSCAPTGSRTHNLLIASPKCVLTLIDNDAPVKWQSRIVLPQKDQRSETEFDDTLKLNVLLHRPTQLLELHRVQLCRV